MWRGARGKTWRSARRRPAPSSPRDDAPTLTTCCCATAATTDSRWARQKLGADAELVELVDSATGERRGVARRSSTASNARRHPGRRRRPDAQRRLSLRPTWLLGPEATGAYGCATRRCHRACAARAATHSPRRLARSGRLARDCTSRSRLHAATARLAAQLRDGLTALPNVELATPAPHPPPSCRPLSRWSPDEAADELGGRVSASSATAGAGLLRAAVGWFNTADEIDRFVGAVALLAEHTPASLPRRPSLTVCEPASAGRTATRAGVMLGGAGRQLRNPPPPVLAPWLATWLSRRSAGCCWWATWSPNRRSSRRRCGRYVCLWSGAAACSLLWVELPVGRSGERRRSAWAGLLGLFAGVPIAYLSLVVIFQLVMPLLP